MALPPGPRMPALLQLAKYTRAPGAFLEACARRYGDAFTLRLFGFGKFVMLANPEHVRAVFTAGPDALHAGEANRRIAGLLGPHSVLVLDGPEHLRQRRVLLPPFQGERMQAYAEVVRAATRASIARWPRGRAFAIDHEMREVALDVILRAVLGMGAGPEKDRLAAEVSGLLDRFTSPWTFFIGAMFQAFGNPGVDRAVRAWRASLDRLFDAAIAARRAAPGEDVLSLLLAATHEDGSPLSDTELRDELMTLIVAGHETTATSLAWAFRDVLADPAARARCRDDDAYCDAAIKESMRLHTIIPIVTRLPTRPFAVGGYEVPRGVNVAPCQYLVHRRPDLYPEPERFEPERFLNAKLDPYAWFPFGGSIRRCIGIWFALFEMRHVIQTVLREADVALAPGPAAGACRRGITIAPRDGTRVIQT